MRVLDYYVENKAQLVDMKIKLAKMKYYVVKH